MSATWFVFQLFISFVQSQRETLVEWTNNPVGWNIIHNILLDDAKFVSYSSYCPGAGSSSCYLINNHVELYTDMDTRGYTDIEVSYDICTTNLDYDEYCSFWYSTTSIDPQEGAWTVLGEHDTNSAKESISLSFPSNVNNIASVGIDFWANMDSGEYCFLNNFVVSGMPINDNPTTSPTAKPTLNPTKRPTKNPSSEPTKFPTASPTKNPLSKPTVFSSQISTIQSSASFPTISPLSTFKPSIAQISSTEISTMSMSTLDTKMTTDTSKDDSAEKELSPNKSEPFMLLYIASAVISICILALCVMCIRAVCKIRKEAIPEVDKVLSLSESMQREKALSNIMNDEDGNHDADDNEVHASDVLAQENADKQPPIEALRSVNRAQVNIKISESVAVEHKQDIMPDIELLERKKEGNAMLKTWLVDIVGLPQYYPLFVKNGFENMAFVKDITNISEVKEIGIKSIADQQHMMHQIKLLKQRDEAVKDDDEFLIEKEDKTVGEACHEENVKIAQDFVHDGAVNGEILIN